ncbi:MAG: hypothetical protein ACLFPL_01040 [Candidatus Nanoarchaeia archaeon]
MVQSTHFSISELERDGIQVYDNNTEKLTAQTDFRGFYKELFNTLINEGFIDGSARKKNSKALKNENIEEYGILVDPSDDSKFKGYKGSRHNGMFERRQRLVKHSTGNTYDFETEWHFRKKTPVLGWWYDFTMNIACRNFEPVEIVDGNSTKKLHRGLWEFRNKVFMIPSQEQLDGLKNVTKRFEPFISQERMENIMLNHLWFKKIMYDRQWCKTTANDYVYDVINKYFKSG